MHGHARFGDSRCQASRSRPRATSAIRTTTVGHRLRPSVIGTAAAPVISRAFRSALRISRLRVRDSLSQRELGPPAHALCSPCATACMIFSCTSGQRFITWSYPTRMT